MKEPIDKAPPAAPSDADDPLNQAPGLRTSQHTLRTAGGYLLDEVVSCLQKAIRRCDEQAALFWALEMQAPSSENNPCGFARYVWRRLCVIASEDVGLVNPNAAVLVNALAQSYERITEGFKKPPTQAEVCLSNAILYLARSPKSRECDDAAMWMGSQRAQGNMLRVPDHALDCHTARGKRMGRTVEHFYSEAARIENVQGRNAYAALVGDEVNVHRYESQDEPAHACWEPVNAGKNDCCSTTADRLLESAKEK